MSKQASDYYFFYAPRDAAFWIVEKEYFHNNGGAINDSSFDGALDAFLPQGFEEVGESQFHYYAGSGLGSWDDGRKLMIAAGFTEIDDPEATKE
jgi:hypothetical protein